jgi:N-acetyl-anhydromuramyl-L-alanine amidase AmpD
MLMAQFTEMAYRRLVPNLIFLQQITPSANKFRARPHGQVIDEIVLHDTGSIGTSLQSRTSLATSTEFRSVHYFIGRENGELFAIVDEYKQAWHAGNPHHVAGVQNHNPQSIGIEMYKLAKDASLDFTDWQYDTVAMLCYDICRRHHISPAGIVGHTQINRPERGDPTNFDWDRFWRLFDQIAYFATLLGPDPSVPMHIPSAINAPHAAAKRAAGHRHAHHAGKKH